MDNPLKQRWRMVLGRYAQELTSSLSEQQCQQDAVLEQLYQESKQKRDFKVSGGLEDSPLVILDWLESAERLFPKSVNDQLFQDAVEHYGLTEVLRQPKVLNQVTPDTKILKQLLKLNLHQNPALKKQVERIIRGVVEQLLQQLTPIFSNRLSGRIHRYAHSPVKRLANLDWHTTVRKNLKHYDGQKLNFERIYFHSRQQKSLPWHIIFCVDQSASMTESMIYSAVIAGVLSNIPAFRLSLLLFDTKVVDFSHSSLDPVAILLKYQLGGGTHISHAWRYAEQLTSEPSKTIVATVSDFCEGGTEQALFAQAQHMIDSGIRMLGMTAMNDNSEPFYDSNTTYELKRIGLDIHSLSPDQLAHWLSLTMGLSK